GSDEHAVVEIGPPRQFDELLDLRLQFAKLVEEFLFLCDFTRQLFFAKMTKLSLDGFYFGLDEIRQAGMQRLVREPVIVEPKRVAPAGGGERPVDGGLATTLRVALQVVGEKA